MIKSILAELKSGISLLTHKGFGASPVLVTENYRSLEGTFKSATRTTGGTSVIVAPLLNGGIFLTDLIITTDKVNLATVTVQWTDGTNTVVIVTAHVTDAPCNLAIPFGGHWEGWQGARLEVVTVGAVKTTVSCGYVKLPESHVYPFDEWDARR